MGSVPNNVMQRWLCSHQTLSSRHFVHKRNYLLCTLNRSPNQTFTLQFFVSNNSFLVCILRNCCIQISLSKVTNACISVLSHSMLQVSQSMCLNPELKTAHGYSNNTSLLFWQLRLLNGLTFYSITLNKTTWPLTMIKPK